MVKRKSLKNSRFFSSDLFSNCMRKFNITFLLFLSKVVIHDDERITDGKTIQSLKGVKQMH